MRDVKMKSVKWILVLLGLTLSVGAITRTITPTRKSNKKRLAACMLEDVATAGLGDVKYSILSEAQFQQVNGAGWVLMKRQYKGDLVTGNEPSVFDYMDGNNENLSYLPDARGVFLRGKSFNSGKNPDGDLLLGTFQDDMFASHTHIQDPHTHNMIGEVQDGATASPGVPRLGGSTIRDMSIQATRAVNQYAGGNETRSKNITVNIFVKVKRNCLDAVTVASIMALQDFNAKNKCDNCLNLPETNLIDLEAKLACFKNEIDLYEADNKIWSVTCTARTVGYAKRVLMLIGVDRTTDDNTWLTHLDNQYPYYNVVTVK